MINTEPSALKTDLGVYENTGPPIWIPNNRIPLEQGPHFGTHPPPPPPHLVNSLGWTPDPKGTWALK